MKINVSNWALNLAVLKVKRSDLRMEQRSVIKLLNFRVSVKKKKNTLATGIFMTCMEVKLWVFNLYENGVENFRWGEKWFGWSQKWQTENCSARFTLFVNTTNRGRNHFFGRKQGECATISPLYTICEQWQKRNERTKSVQNTNSMWRVICQICERFVKNFFAKCVCRSRRFFD